MKRQITDQLVAPSDILQYERPAKRHKDSNNLNTLNSQGMDKRHPSSFQQLEKVYKSIEEVMTITDNVFSWARAPTQQYDNLLITSLDVPH